MSCVKIANPNGVSRYPLQYERGWIVDLVGEFHHSLILYLKIFPTVILLELRVKKLIICNIISLIN